MQVCAGLFDRRSCGREIKRITFAGGDFGVSPRLSSTRGICCASGQLWSGRVSVLVWGTLADLSRLICGRVKAPGTAPHGSLLTRLRAHACAHAGGTSALLLCSYATVSASWRRGNLCNCFDFLPSLSCAWRCCNCIVWSGACPVLQPAANTCNLQVFDVKKKKKKAIVVTQGTAILCFSTVSFFMLSLIEVCPTTPDTHRRLKPVRLPSLFLRERHLQ